MRYISSTIQSGMVLIIVTALLSGGCTTGARQGAAQGGAMGFIGGIAAGAVNSLLFGGNVLEGAVQGGVAGAAGGAAGGAVQGGMVERQAGKTPAKTSDKDIAALRKKQGDLNFQAAALLVQCQHEQAVAAADRAFAETDKKERKVFALTLRAAAELESGKADAAEASYAKIAEVDPKRSIDQARADTLQALLKVQGIRNDHGLKPCGG